MGASVLRVRLQDWNWAILGLDKIGDVNARSLLPLLSNQNFELAFISQLTVHQIRHKMKFSLVAILLCGICIVNASSSDKFHGGKLLNFICCMHFDIFISELTKLHFMCRFT